MEDTHYPMARSTRLRLETPSFSSVHWKVAIARFEPAAPTVILPSCGLHVNRILSGHCWTSAANAVSRVSDIGTWWWQTWTNWELAEHGKRLGVLKWKWAAKAMHRQKFLRGIILLLPVTQTHLDMCARVPKAPNSRLIWESSDAQNIISTRHIHSLSRLCHPIACTRINWIGRRNLLHSSHWLSPRCDDWFSLHSIFISRIMGLSDHLNLYLSFVNLCQSKPICGAAICALSTSSLVPWLTETRRSS